uniref:uncharacterized protein LOC100181117 isoform X1 n=1 Tax=Ciona intestinalis TaxID=7719 RepID=UPI000EF4D60B|nr:uncharacterized protein LOC100181117 isoform X1 [Ciona intestinalis]|eukprot:XP_026689788.1 uncharacterized protein LOC100181117 isoform X1 [Ciona intestinalis]
MKIIYIPSILLGYLLVVQANEDQQHACNMQSISTPALEWSFERNLTCSERRIPLVPGGLDGLPGKRVGDRCTYTYSCPMDPPGPHRSTTLTCQLNGEWEGTMPDCSADDRMVSYVLNLLMRTSNETTVRMAERGEKESRPLSSYPGSVKKSSTSNKVRNYCKKQKICERASRITDCWNTQKISDVQPRTRRRRQAMVGLCIYCYKSYCTKTTMVTLL